MDRAAPTDVSANNCYAPQGTHTVPAIRTVRLDATTGTYRSFG